MPIAGVLGSLDEKIELNRKKIAELEALAKTIYYYWFVQYDFPDANGKPYKSSGGKMVWNEQLKREVPVGWEVFSLGRLTNTTLTHDNMSTSTAIYVSTENLLPNMKGYLREEKSLQTIVGGHNFVKNDILVSNIRPYFQKIWYANENGIASSDVLRFHAVDHPSVLYYSLANSHFFEYVMKGAKGSKMPRGDKAHISRFAISWGTSAIRNQASIVFQEILTTINHLDIEISHLSNVRDYILPLLMNGQVIVK